MNNETGCDFCTNLLICKYKNTMSFNVKKLKDAEIELNKIGIHLNYFLVCDHFIPKGCASQPMSPEEIRKILRNETILTMREVYEKGEN